MPANYCGHLRHAAEGGKLFEYTRLFRSRDSIYDRALGRLA